MIKITIAKIDRDENYNGQPDDLEKLPRLPWPEDTQDHNIACGEAVSSIRRNAIQDRVLRNVSLPDAGMRAE